METQKNESKWEKAGNQAISATFWVYGILLAAAGAFILWFLVIPILSYLITGK